MRFKSKLRKMGFQVSKVKTGLRLEKNGIQFLLWSMRIDNHKQVLIRRGNWMWFKHIIRYGEIEGTMDNRKFLKFQELNTPEVKILRIITKDAPLFVQTEGTHKRFLLPEDSINEIHIMNQKDVFLFLTHYPNTSTGTKFQF